MGLCFIVTGILYKYKLKLVHCEQKENKRKAVEQAQGLDEQHDDQGLDEDVNAVEVFKEFHTSKKDRRMRDAARQAVVSTFICFS